jgi:hypothetical protein
VNPALGSGVIGATQGELSVQPLAKPDDTTSLGLDIRRRLAVLHVLGPSISWYTEYRSWTMLDKGTNGTA